MISKVLDRPDIFIIDARNTSSGFQYVLEEKADISFEENYHRLCQICWFVICNSMY